MLVRMPHARPLRRDEGQLYTTTHFVFRPFNQFCLVKSRSFRSFKKFLLASLFTLHYMSLCSSSLLFTHHRQPKRRPSTTGEFSSDNARICFWASTSRGGKARIRQDRRSAISYIRAGTCLLLIWTARSGTKLLHYI